MFVIRMTLSFLILVFVVVVVVFFLQLLYVYDLIKYLGHNNVHVYLQEFILQLLGFIFVAQPWKYYKLYQQHS